MRLRKFLKIFRALILLFLILIGIISINHPITLKWIFGTARLIGRPINATVYTDGQVNGGIKVFHVDRYWGNNQKANSYLLRLTEFDSLGRLKFININLNEKWVGSSIGTSKKDYDFILANLFQSETGGHYVPFQHDMKGFDFDPQLSFTDKEIRFNVPPNKLPFVSVRIVID